MFESIGLVGAPCGGLFFLQAILVRWAGVPGQSKGTPGIVGKVTALALAASDQSAVFSAAWAVPQH